MNQIFESNIEILAKKNKALADAIVSPAVEPVHLEKAKTGAYTFKYKDKYFHSSYDPLKEAARHVEEVLAKKFDWVLLFGMGCGYIPKLLLEKGKEKIIVYEPRLEILKGVLSEIDLKDIISMDTFYLCHTLDSLADILRNYTDGMDNLLGYYTPPYRLEFSVELNEFLNRVNNAHIMNKVGIRTEVASRLMWIDNYIANLKHLARHRAIDALKGGFKDCPLIIVGAGPSLEKNAHLLKDLKGKAVILAAITAYKPLLKFDVVPDFVIAAEKVDLPEYFTYGEEDKEIRLILGEMSNPNMFTREVKGKFVYFNAYLNLSVEHIRFWGSDYFPASGGSVTTCAIDMGVMLGCNPIIFIGQDLAFGEGKSYADGSVYKKSNVTIDKEKGMAVVDLEYQGYNMPSGKTRPEHDVLWLKGLNSEWVASKYDWVTFHQWFENYMIWLKKEHPSQIVVNATEGGAYINGMEHIKLIEAIEKYNINKNAPIEDIISKVEMDRPDVDFDELAKSFAKMADAFKSIRIFAKAIVKEARVVEKIFKTKGMTHEFSKSVKRIKRIEEKLFKKTEHATFIWEVLSSCTYQLKEYLRKDIDEKEDKQFKKDLDVVLNSYSSVVESCDMFLPKLEKAVEDVKECGSCRPWSAK